MSSTTSTGPFAGESKADAWLFEHSRFLRKHFSPNGPAEIPTKKELIRERASGDAFPRETKIDAALFGHSKFLRKRFKHEENVEGGIKSKSKMLRESLDGKRDGSLKHNDIIGEREGEGYIAEEGQGEETQDDFQDDFQDDPITPAAVDREAPKDKEVRNGVDYYEDIPGNGAIGESTYVPAHGILEDQTYAPSAALATAPAVPPSSVPAWAAAQDNARSYGSAEKLSAVAAAPSAGLIEHHPTTMESTGVNGRPEPHSLQSNAKIAEEEVTTEEPVMRHDVMPEEGPAVIHDVAPNEEPAMIHDVVPKEEPAMIHDVVPKEEPVMIHDVVPKEEPAMRHDVLPKEEPPMRHNVVPKEEPAMIYDMVTDEPSLPGQFPVV